MEFGVCLYKENMAAQSSGAVIAEMCHFPHFANGHKICTLFDFLHPSFSSTSQTHNGFEVIVKEVFLCNRRQHTLFTPQTRTTITTDRPFKRGQV